MRFLSLLLAAALTLSACARSRRLDDAGPGDMGPRDLGGAVDEGPADAGPLCVTDGDCNDGDSCTRDRCDPELGCQNILRDLDGDGYAAISCEGGLDCDDDPLTGVDVNPDAEEICDDGIDNDCDGLGDVFDVEDCPSTNDSCDSASELEVGFLSFGVGGDFVDDYDLDCDPDVPHVDLVFQFTVGFGRLVDIAVPGALAIEVRRVEDCAIGGEAIACTNEPDSPRGDGPRLSFERRTIGRLTAGTYVVIVSVPREPDFYSLEYIPRTIGILEPREELCDGVAPDVTESRSFTERFSLLQDDYPSLDCGREDGAFAPDAGYHLLLSERSDVEVTATATFGDEARDARWAIVEDCAAPNETALACTATTGGVATPLVQEGLAAGEYWILVEPDDTRPAGDYQLDVTITPSP